MKSFAEVIAAYWDHRWDEYVSSCHITGFNLSDGSCSPEVEQDLPDRDIEPVLNGAER